MILADLDYDISLDFTYVTNDLPMKTIDKLELLMMTPTS